MRIHMSEGNIIKTVRVERAMTSWDLCISLGTRHTDNSRSSAPDIAVPRQALCYLSRSNRGLKNRRLSLQHPLFLALVNQGNHKQQNAEPSKRIVP